MVILCTKDTLDLLWIYCGMQRPNTMQDKNETGTQARTKIQAKKKGEEGKKDDHSKLDMQKNAWVEAPKEGGVYIVSIIQDSYV